LKTVLTIGIPKKKQRDKALIFLAQASLAPG
jgi:hypothetical protein